MKSYKSIVIKSSSNIREAMRVIEKGSMKIALVTDEQERLIGTLTDGDLRRAILNGATLEMDVHDVMSKKPTVCHIGDSYEVVLEMALSKKLYQVPIVNDQGVLVGLHQVNDLLKPSKKDNPVIIMAGGQGVRLRPLTIDTPKPLLKVGGKPILETIIKSFKKHGFNNFYISVNYKSEMIQSNFGDGSDFGVNIEYLKESHQLGTAGAIGQLRGELSHPFFVINGDILTNINFNALLSFHNKNKSLATMGVRNYDHQIPYGVVEVDNNQIISIKEKPTYSSLVNAGIYLFNPSILDTIPLNKAIDMPDVFQNLITKKLKTCTYLIEDYWVDIGRLDELRRADSEYHEVF